LFSCPETKDLGEMVLASVRIHLSGVDLTEGFPSTAETNKEKQTNKNPNACTTLHLLHSEVLCKKLLDNATRNN